MSATADSVTSKHKRQDSMVLNAMQLQFIEGRFVFSSSTEALEINRRDGTISVGSEFGQPESSALRIYGIVGTIRLLKGPYLIVITDRDDVGKIQGERIWRVRETKVIPYKEYCSLTPKQEEDEERYLKMLNQILHNRALYFSYSFDLTNSLQRRKSLSEEDKQKPIWQRADSRFFWNRYLLEPFINSGAHVQSWIVPLMIGHVAIGANIAFPGNQKADVFLISRRSVHRVGTRFWTRGIDSEGHVANFVETEEIIALSNGDQSSFVQIRGSIPVYWTQYVNTMWAPKPVVANDSHDAFSKHFDDVIATYGKPTLVVNLANQHGSEGRLVDAFSQNVDKYAQKDGLDYVKFDFHKECPGLNWSQVDQLVNKVSKRLDEIGHFSWKDGAIEQKQNGTVRTNCIDNLDRTNLLQGLFAKRWTENRLRAYGLLSTAAKLDSNPILDYFLKNAWADNADAISLQYAGAGALKSDFTRFGKRTTQGMLQDGVNAIQRYVLNNFFDGSKQDAYNLFLGNYKVKPAESPFAADAQTIRRYTQWGLLALFFYIMFVTSAMNPIGGSFGFWVLVLLFWGASFGVVYLVAKTYGSKLVDRPKLIIPPMIAEIEAQVKAKRD